MVGKLSRRQMQFTAMKSGQPGELYSIFAISNSYNQDSFIYVHECKEKSQVLCIFPREISISAFAITIQIIQTPRWSYVIFSVSKGAVSYQE